MFLSLLCRRMPSTIENDDQFKGMLGENAVTRKNAKELAAIRAREAAFLRAVSEYQTAQKSLDELTKRYREATSSNKKAGKGAEVNGQQGFINSRGFFQKYTGGKPAAFCPPAPEFSIGGNIGPVGTPIGSSGILVGNDIGPKGACAPAGVNLQVTSVQDVANMNDQWVGCFRDVARTGMRKQSDLTNAGQNACKTRAADRGTGNYGLVYEGGNIECYIGPDSARASMPTELGTKSINYLTSASVAADTNSAAVGLNGAGQLYAQSSSGAVNYVNGPQPGCVVNGPNMGAKISVDAATWGANCNGQVKI